MTKTKIMIPISLGELLDRITILEIKTGKITQAERARNVRVELDYLVEVRLAAIGELTGQLAESANELKAINQRIWDAEDALHQGNTISETDFTMHARVAFSQNDARARVKRHVNELAGSEIVEEKATKGLGQIS